MRRRRVLRARVRRLCPVGDIGEMVMNGGPYVERWLHVVAAVRFPAEMLVFKRMGVGSVVALPTRVELVELVGRIRRWMKEGCEEGL